ncbi:MAG TPA: glycogen debranching N-terminal domain-containing protein [Candidatus Dormibacteraeota bacterium]|nr:glycogen debranching N-terminal domain-containing protein [Candidatus Dormibacteraeota bacterium]
MAQAARAWSEHPAPEAVPAVHARGHALHERRRVARTTLTTVSPGPATVTINHGQTFLVSSLDGAISSRDGGVAGVYTDDTRFISHHELRLNGRRLKAIATSRLSFRHARWVYVTEVADGDDDAPTISVTLDRVISAHRLHEDLVVRAYGDKPVSSLISMFMQSDFADIFEVRTAQWRRRSKVRTTWTHPDRLETTYVRDDFVRRWLLRVNGGAGSYANGELRFAVDLDSGGEWRVCMQHDLLTSRSSRPAVARCPVQTGLVDRAERLTRHWHHTVSRARPADLRLQLAYQQAVTDYAALRLYDHDFSTDVWLPAAGIPWFVAPFGRDSILASIEAMPLHPLFAVGTLQKLASWQSEVDDPVRDAEPGKIPHEMRVGELAHFHEIPHTPYYGTADATPLYLLLLADAYRWLGDAHMLRRFRTTAIRCLEWIDRYGDLDGDGLQEYRPRAPGGYRNQCWRDAIDGVLDEDGNNPPHPIGTCEMQAYVYAAKRNVAALFEAWGDEHLARTLRTAAESLQRTFIERYWLEDEGTVCFALDGNKRQVRTATSNPGQCLWLGILDRERGQRAARRLLRDDLFSGWGLRTLSALHPRFDPHSYQRGSVWPHDTMLAAAGMRRYDLVDECWRLIDALLDAVASFEHTQMPELFAGLRREAPDTPIPYEMANVPQAWSAGVVFQAVRTLLGLEPDVPNNRVYLDPLLPPWCPELQLDNVRVGNDRMTIHAVRTAGGEIDLDVATVHRTLEVVRGRPPWLDCAPAF